MQHKIIPENAETKLGFPVIFPVKVKIAADKINQERKMYSKIIAIGGIVQNDDIW